MAAAKKSRRSISPLRAYYNALEELKEYEQTALAEAHASNPALLVRRFYKSVQGFDEPIREPFYNVGRADPSDPRYAASAAEVNSTIKFAAQICDGAARPVEHGDALAFRYVDREISPLRTTGESRAPRRSLDLLLANARDGAPIFAELKIGADKPSYFALVQLLANAADLLPDPQLDRLFQQYGGDKLSRPRAGPFIDLYLIASKSPNTGAYRHRSFVATEAISKKLIADRPFAELIRRIAFIEAVARGDRLEFHKRFAYGAGL